MATKRVLNGGCCVSWLDTTVTVGNWMAPNSSRGCCGARGGCSKSLPRSSGSVERHQKPNLHVLQCRLRAKRDLKYINLKERSEDVEIKAIIGDQVLLETTLQNQLNSCLKKSPSPERKRDKLRFNFPQECDDEQ